MPFHNLQEILNQAKDVPQEKIEDVEGVILLDLGEETEARTIVIRDGKVKVEEGQTEPPDLTVQATAQDLLDLANGELNPMIAFVRKKIRFSGDMELAMKLQTLFQGR